jgi:hypothetical protein
MSKYNQYTVHTELARVRTRLDRIIYGNNVSSYRRPQ